MKRKNLNIELLAGVGILLIYLLPNWLFLDEAKFLVHDNLDSNVVWFKNLVSSGTLFVQNNVIVPNTLGGIPRGFYPSEVNVIPILYFFFKPLIAYHLNIICMHLVAFVGMYLLAKTYFFTDSKNEKWGVWIAVVFALIPFWPSGGLTIAGQPLLLFAFLNIINNQKNTVNWFIIGLYPCYSSLVFGNMFVMMVGFCSYLLYAMYNKQINYKVMLAFALFTTTSVLAEYRLFLLYLNEMPEIQRNTWLAKTGSLNWKGVIGVTTSMVFKGAYHFFGRIFPLIPVAVALGWIIASKRSKIKIFLLFLLVICVSVPTVIKSNFLLAENFSWLFVINPRFVALHSILWFIMLMLALREILIHPKVKNWMVQLFFILIILTHFFNFFKSDYQGSDYLEHSFYYTFFDKVDYKYKTMSSYYLQHQFEAFKQATNHAYDGQLMSCIDIRPEIAQFNGFHTLGGYYAIYPMDFCKKYLYLIGKDINGMCSSRCYFKKEHLASGLIDKLRTEKVQLLVSRETIQDEKMKLIYEQSKFYVYHLK